MEVKIKRLGPDDIVLAKNLMISWLEGEVEELREFPKEDYLKKNLSRDDFYVLVALHRKQVVGGLTAYELPKFTKPEHEMFLYEIGVIQPYRRKGIASKLIEKLKEICVRQSIKTIFVGTSLKNKAARELYTKTGGEVEICPWYTYPLNNIPQYLP